MTRTKYIGYYLVIILSFTVSSMLSQVSVVWDGLDWEEGSASHSFFKRIGTDAENNRVIGTAPDGTSQVVWRCGSDVARGPDGGWNTSTGPKIDPTKTYRYSVWIKRAGNNRTNGRSYHGVGNVRSLTTDATVSNPYFWAGFLPELDTWYLMVGVVHPFDYKGGDSDESGLYDINGNKVKDFKEFKWKDKGITKTNMRSYLFYATDITSTQDFWYPQLEMIEGTNTGGVSAILQRSLEGDGTYTSVETAPSLSGAWNQTASISFDYAGNTIEKSKNYFNYLGKGVQGLSWDVLTNKVWASQTMYDYHGRPAIQTLSAPVNGGLSYSSDFIESASGSYSLSNYDQTTTINNPSTVSTNSELGQYYSSLNTDNPYQDITQYPFTRSVYSKLNPGSVLKVLGGNKIEGEWKQTYSFSMSAANDLASPAAFGPGYDSNLKLTKSVSRDVHGVEVVVFQDVDGNTLAAARSGNETGQGVNHTVSQTIGRQGFIDIHLPQGISSFNVSIPAGLSVKRYNLITEQEIYTNSPGAGFYRIAVVNPEGYAASGLDITVSHQVNYYDYSLNSYDKVNRLVSSTQPLSASLESSFVYNSLGQLLETTSPDEGTAKFKYRDDGQIRFSQNSKQLATGAFSYTNYDELGRPIESGVYDGPVSFNSANPNTPDGLANNYCSEVNTTLYDINDNTGIASAFSKKGCANVSSLYKQQFLAGSVSRTRTTDALTTTTWYSYDVLGRVDWVVQEIEGLPCPKTINYNYEPSTGLVASIDYQRHNTKERFIHQYTYNQAGQLTAVHTSTDAQNYLLQAEYIYNETGALTRTIIGENLQGIDYVYNLNGQLKAINHPSLNPVNDPGNDGGAGSNIAADIFGLSLDYYNGDYSRSATPTPIAQQNTNGIDQYNGNIKSLRFNTDGFNVGGSGDFNMYTYGYSKNNWLSNASFGGGSIQAISGNKHRVNFTPDSNQDYGVDNLNYDANGNILSLSRKGYTDTNGTNTMDDFSYNYEGNKLQGITDTGDNPDADRYNDLKDQTNNGQPNYVYNDIGQLVADYQGAAFYEYNTAGLVTRVNTYLEGNTTTGGEQITLYSQNHSAVTDDELQFWEVSAPNSSGTTPDKSIHYSGTYSDLLNPSCTTLNNTYGRSLKLNLGSSGTATRKYDVIPGKQQTFSLDIIALQYSVIIQTGESHETPTGYTITLYNDDGSTLATNTFNAALDYIDDPDLGSGECSKFYNNTESFTVTPSSNRILLEVKRISNNTFLPMYIDNVGISATIVPVIDIAYNDRGHRVKKTSYSVTNAAQAVSNTYYVRDVSGSILAVYDQKPNGQKEDPILTELTIYGASRLGVYKPQSKFIAANATPYSNYLYELTDHLGNVRAVLNKPSQGTVAAISKTDYYPFGMPMPNRNVEGNYRYAYQGQEKDPETGKEAFQLRLWDSRIGRWLTIDPYNQFDSPYLGMSNNPILYIDPDGGFACPDGDCSDVNGGSLGEVIVTASGNGSAGAPHIPDQDRFAGSFAQWSQKYGQAFSSTDRDLAELQWSVSYGDEHNAKFSPSNQWRIDATGFAAAFEAGATNWGPGDIGYDLQMIATYGIGGTILTVGGAGIIGGYSTGGLTLQGGRTFAQYRTAYWGTRSKPALQIIRGPNGQVFKNYMELHHRFIPQRLKWAPNWLKNNRLNLQPLRSLEHGLKDSYRYRFFPKWLKQRYPR